MSISVPCDDIVDVTSDTIIPWKKFYKKTIFVTGCTGLIGKLLIESLLHISRIKDLQLKIVAAVRDISKDQQRLSSIMESDGYNVTFVRYDLVEDIVYENEVDYVFHGACVTDSSFFVTNPVESMWSIALGTKNILDFSIRSKAESIVMCSTMEVYGHLDSQKISENESGFLDQLAVRSSYPQGKRFAETLSAAYWNEYAAPVKIARLTQTLGSTLRPTDQRVFAQFSRCMAEDRDIILHTAGKTRRDYLYVSDAVRALVTILLQGKNGESYNVSNEDTHISVYDMAKLCASMHGSINVKFEDNEDASKAYMKEHIIALDTSKLAALGWKPQIDLKEAYSRILVSMKQSQNEAEDNSI